MERVLKKKNPVPKSSTNRDLGNADVALNGAELNQVIDLGKDDITAAITESERSYLLGEGAGIVGREHVSGEMNQTVRWWLW